MPNAAKKKLKDQLETKVNNLTMFIIHIMTFKNCIPQQDTYVTLRYLQSVPTNYNLKGLTAASLANTCKTIRTVVIVKRGWHVFSGEAVSGVRDHQAGLANRAVANQNYLDPLIKRCHGMLRQVLILRSGTNSHRRCRRRCR